MQVGGANRRGWLLVGVVLVVCGCAWAQTGSRLVPREAIEKHLKSFSDDNDRRETLVRKWLANAGCKGRNLSEQAVGGSLPPNVVCVLPGETQEIIIVGAHTDKVEAGDGVVDNWTGATLLPALFYSLNEQPRHHTFVFIGFSGEEQGLVGSRFYADHLRSEQRSRIDAMINFDSLGLGPTEVWAAHADKALVDGLSSVAEASKLPLTTMNPENGASTDSESFARYQIPRITLHSVTPLTWSILHSSRDRMGAIKISDYYDSYRLIAAYLAYLDGQLKPAAAMKP
jgi:Peptidase family M28